MEKENVKTVIQSLYQLTQAEITNQDGTTISVVDLQDLFYSEVSRLADLIGIELED